MVLRRSTERAAGYLEEAQLRRLAGRPIGAVLAAVAEAAVGACELLEERPGGLGAGAPRLARAATNLGDHAASVVVGVHGFAYFVQGLGRGFGARFGFGGVAAGRLSRSAVHRVGAHSGIDRCVSGIVHIMVFGIGRSVVAGRLMSGTPARVVPLVALRGRGIFSRVVGERSVVELLVELGAEVLVVQAVGIVAVIHVRGSCTCSAIRGTITAWRVLHHNAMAPRTYDDAKTTDPELNGPCLPERRRASEAAYDRALRDLVAKEAVRRGVTSQASDADDIDF